MEQIPPGKKKKVIRYKTVAAPDKVLKMPGIPEKKKPVESNWNLERGTTKTEYVPKKVETGQPDYGKPGSGTDPEMNRLIKAAQDKKQDNTEYSSKGLHYKAGETKTTTTPSKFSTSIQKITPPDIRLKQTKQVPVYERTPTKKSSNLKAMDLTFGGSDRRGDPANKRGLGMTKKVRIRSVKSNPRGYHR